MGEGHPLTYVSCSITGANGDTGPRKLAKSKKHFDKFEKGHTDVFDVSCRSALSRPSQRLCASATGKILFAADISSLLYQCFMLLLFMVRLVLLLRSKHWIWESFKRSKFGTTIRD